jgi:CubicO group peptidase (beta-lactamase class C family)
MYAFLSGYSLSRDPGTAFEYSNLGASLLGLAIALKAEAVYGFLIEQRICRPLGMNSTCVAPTPEMRARMAMGHDESGDPLPPWNLDAYAPVGAVHSTANDLSAESVGWTLLQRMPLTNRSATEFARQMVGIGTALDFDPATQTLRITNVFAKSPAAQTGLYAGLLVQKIDDVSTIGKSLAECVDLVRGPAGTKVRLVILDPERNATTTVELTREKFVTSNS